MMIRQFKIILCTVVTLVGFAANGFVQKAPDESHILVALRMIGHQVLLQAGDSTSRILPIEKERKRYKLQFTSEFHFDPDHLVSLVDSVVERSQIAESYLVEVESCQENQVVYSYRIGNSERLDLVPCRGRIQPEGCYQLFFTILDFPGQKTIQGDLALKPSEPDRSVQKELDYSNILTILAVLVLVGVFFYFLKNRRATGKNPNLIRLGKYKFDVRNMELRHNDEMAELSSKESDLLLLLYTSANTTLPRELILKAVWGDEGDYIGRTLDVFISKLRKKLNADPSLKIVNIRGVGYKLVLNE